MHTYYTTAYVMQQTSKTDDAKNGRAPSKAGRMDPHSLISFVNIFCVRFFLFQSHPQYNMYYTYSKLGPVRSTFGPKKKKKKKVHWTRDKSRVIKKMQAAFLFHLIWARVIVHSLYTPICMYMYHPSIHPWR